MKYKHSTSFLILVLLLLVTSCKTSKTLTGNTSNLKLSAKQLVKANAKTTASFKTLQSKLKITYTEGSKRQTHTVSYRMQKDAVLWLSAPFGIIRAKITPDQVAFYNKLDNTYFEGDFEYFTKLLGTTLDFEKIQNLLLGEALYSLEDSAYKVSILEGQYVLQPKAQQELFELFYILSPKNYKVVSQQLSQAKAQRHLQIDYLSYQNVLGQELPEQIKVIAVEGPEERVAELEFKSVTLNGEIRFPFKIPSGFKKIEL